LGCLFWWKSAAQSGCAAEKAGLPSRCRGTKSGLGKRNQGLVLLRKSVLCRPSALLQGGVSLRTAEAPERPALRVCSGVHLLLTNGSQVNSSLKDFSQFSGAPYYCNAGRWDRNSAAGLFRVGTRWSGAEEAGGRTTASRFSRLSRASWGYSPRPWNSRIRRDTLPMSEDIGTAKELAAKHGTAKPSSRLSECNTGISHAWPFCEDSSLCRDHGTRFPIVQGLWPRERHPNFLAAVAAGGALPFSHGQHAGPMRERESVLPEKNQRRFGVGLIGWN